MAYERLTDDLDIISKLDTEPNDVGGLSAEELKAKFDEAGNAIKTYINETLLPSIEGENGAENTGIETIGGISMATNVQDALIQIVQLINDISQGSVPDGSITTLKLADDAVTADKLADNAVGNGNITAGAVTAEKLAALAVTTAKLAAKCVTSGKIADKAVGTGQLADGAVTNGKLASNAVQTGNIYEKAVSTAKLADGSVTNAKLANGAVSTGKLATSAVTRAKLAEDALYSPMKSVTTQAYSVVADDLGKTLHLTYNGAVSITLSNEVLSALPRGAEIAFVRGYISGSNKSFSITVGSNWYLERPGNLGSKGRTLTCSEPYSLVAIKKVTGDELIATGNFD